MAFISMFTPLPDPGQPGRWFIFKNDRMLVCGTGAAAEVPLLSEADPAGIQTDRRQFLGMLDGTPCYAASIDAAGNGVAEGMALLPLRKLFGLLPDEHFRLALRASQLMYWDRTSRFCGQCGNPARLSTTERAKVCTACGGA
jgi:NAD+ diphosphatase